MSTKVKVEIEELASIQVLPFTIFDENNHILLHKGTVLNSQVMSMLFNKNLFKVQIDSPPYLDAYGISKISQDTTDYIINITSEFLDLVRTGKKPTIDAVYLARDKIVDEVHEYIKTLNSINEIRIYYDDYYIAHSINVATLATAIAIKLEYKPEELREITLAAMMHDVGMTKIPKQILNKPEKLTPKEYELVKLHAPLGYKIAKEEYGLSNSVALAIMDHHERHDGSGYTRALELDKISKYAQIIAIADVYDAASSNKSYAASKTPKQIVKELLLATKCFNPKIMYTLIHMVDYNKGYVTQK